MQYGRVEDMNSRTITRYFRRFLIIAATSVIAVALSGCFWTPDDADEGGITINLYTGDLGASAVDDYEGIFMAYVVADDLLRGDPNTAQQAIDEVDNAFDEALTGFFIGQMEAAFGGSSSFDFSDFRVDVNFPSIQFQAEFLTGSSGSNSFRGLKADREYLVVVVAAGEDSEGVGFTTTTVKGGDTRSVDLQIGDNWDTFDTFLAGRYALSQPSGVDLTLLPIGKLDSVPDTLYYDVIELGDGVTQVDLANYYWFDGSQEYDNLYVHNGNFSLDQQPLDSLITVDAVGAARTPLPANRRIQGLTPGTNVQIVVTDRSSRTSFPTGTERFVVGVSDPFVVEESGDEWITLYEWGASIGGDLLP